MKRRLSEQQEFEIMKIVLDKFLWLGFGIMAYGLYLMYTTTIPLGLSWMIALSRLTINLFLSVIKTL